METIELFIPCLVREFLPETGIATAKVLKSFGYKVHFNPKQVCCGQVFINWGDQTRAVKSAHKFLQVFQGDRIVVGPSGSCVGAVRERYGELGLSREDMDRWRALRGKIFDVLEFLKQRNHRVKGRFKARVAIHRSCHLLREIGVDPTQGDLWDGIDGLQIVYPSGMPECCGFGGVFSIKMGETAATTGHRAVQRLVALNPDIILVPDAGCIMQVRSVLKDLGVDIRVMHPIELLAQAQGQI